MYPYSIQSYQPSERLQAEIHLVALEDNRTDAQVVQQALRVYFDIRRRMRDGAAFGFIEQDRKALLAHEIVGY